MNGKRSKAAFSAPASRVTDSEKINNESRGSAVAIETINVCKDGAVLFAEINAPPMKDAGRIGRDSAIQVKVRRRRDER